MFGFLNVYKPVDMTSHDVVSVLRRVTKFKHIGHAGTLDPFARGVLPILLGKAARLSDFLSEEKAYIADIQFGKNTDTYDRCGEVTEIFDKKIQLPDLQKEVQNFIGEIIQNPPIYSAIKVNGKRLYEIAREKGGKEQTDVKIPERKVIINNINIIDFNFENQTAKIEVDCKKGTYIRSLAYDIGKSLDCGAYLEGLERTVSGPFALDSAIKLENLKTIEDVEKNIINPVQMLPQYKKVDLTDEENELVRHGRNVEREQLQDGEVLLVYKNNISAVGKSENGSVKPEKVFI